MIPNIYYLCIWLADLLSLTSASDWLVLLLPLHLVGWSSSYLCIGLAGPPLTSASDWLVLAGLDWRLHSATAS